MATPTIKAIETEYAGCRFRSRLEARWAVFFDHLGIRWEYEPEGLEIGSVRYLPDFRLPDLMGAYVEVKGQMDVRGMQKILALAGAGRRVLVLSDVPRPDDLGPHFTFFMRRRGVVEATWVSLLETDPHSVYAMVPLGWPCPAPKDESKAIEWGVALVEDLKTAPGFVLLAEAVSAGFETARSARFEFGECRR